MPSRLYIAEGVGTFMIVLCGTGVIVLSNPTAAVGTNVPAALIFGAIVAVMVIAFRSISGAHFNPAITIGMWAARKFPGRRVMPYIISQVTGATAASRVVELLAPSRTTLGITQPGSPLLPAFLSEIALTCVLVSVILMLVGGRTVRDSTAAIIIGAVIGSGIMILEPVSGASMNPARSLAPALVSMHCQYLWLYLIAPIVGAVLAAIIRWKVGFETVRVIRDQGL